MKLKQILLMGAVVMPLVACGGGEPSEAQMKEAVLAKIEAELANIPSGFMKDKMKIEVLSFKKIECAEAESKPGYLCDMEMTAKVMGKERTQTSSARFVKGDDGWKAIEE